MPVNLFYSSTSPHLLLPFVQGYELYQNLESWELLCSSPSSVVPWLEKSCLSKALLCILQKRNQLLHLLLFM